MAVAPRVCIRHPERPADYVCTRCARWQCQGCSKPLTDAYESARTCAHCNGIVRIGDVSTGVESVGEALSRLLSSEAVMTIVALAVPAMLMAVGTLFAALMAIIYVGVLATYYFECIDHVGAARSGLPFSSSASSIYAIGSGLVRAVFPAVLALGPALAAFNLVNGSTLLTVLSLLLGVGLMPASLLAGVVTRSTLNQLWPLVWFEIINRNPRAYAKLLGWIYGSLLWWAATIIFFDWLLNGSVLRWIVLPLLHNTCAIIQAILFGRFLQQHGPDYGVAYVK